MCSGMHKGDEHLLNIGQIFEASETCPGSIFLYLANLCNCFFLTSSNVSDILGGEHILQFLDEFHHSPGNTHSVAFFTAITLQIFCFSVKLKAQSFICFIYSSLFCDIKIRNACLRLICKLCLMHCHKYI